ncbi:MAG TPA: hypothetical protein VE688_08295, partial [Gaiellaceae bacterium]|nr:hypothetical protein [Gaiellaceae bacterium]
MASREGRKGRKRGRRRRLLFIAPALASVGASDTRTIGVGVHVLHVAPGGVRSAVRRLESRPGVRFAEPDYIAQEART